MNQYKITYFFEHELLPSLFFTRTEKFVNRIANGKNALFMLMSTQCTEEGAENVYGPGDFDATPVKIAEDKLALIIRFPEPIGEPLCYYAVLLFDPTFKKKAYYCVEMADPFGESDPFLCGWDENGRHLNFGKCKNDMNDILGRCASMF